MSEQIHQQSQLSYAGQGALHKFADRAALLLDANGVIRSATLAAAALFQRPVRELIGVPFGIVPLTQPEIHVDLVNPGGRCRTVVARSVASDLARDWTVVLLAEQALHLFEHVAPLALADVAPVLAAHRLTLEVGPWPFIEAHPATRELLADSVRELVEKAAPRSGTLIVYANVASGAWIAVGLLLFDSGTASVHPAVPADFEALTAKVRAAEGFLQVDCGDGGWGLQLMLPAGRPDY